MTALPEPRPTPLAGQRESTLSDSTLSDSILDAAVDKAIEQARIAGTSPRVLIGNTPPEAQPDSLIVPAWATGIAVASIGVGAGSTGLGCAAWLLFKGLSLVSVPSLQQFMWIVIAPFAGLAMVLTAAGAAISKAKKTIQTTTHIYEGTVVQNTEINDNQTHTRGVIAKTDNRKRGLQ